MAGLPLGGRNVDLEQLKAELTAAGVSVASIGTIADNLVTYNAQGEPTDPPAGVAAVVAVHTPSTVLRDQLVSVLTSTVGVALTDLTNAQRLALIGALLYKVGGITRQGIVRPLNQWLVN